MPAVMLPKVKRGWEFDEDLVAAFDQWIETTGMQKNAAVQLGLWLVMHVDPHTRQDAMDLMQRPDTRQDASIRLSRSVEPDLPPRLAEEFKRMLETFGFREKRAVAAAIASFVAAHDQTIEDNYASVSDYYAPGQSSDATDSGTDATPPNTDRRAEPDPAMVAEIRRQIDRVERERQEKLRQQPPPVERAG